MKTAETHPILQITRWLALHAGFPASRLESRAELLILLAAAAAEEEIAVARKGGFGDQRRDVAKDAALRAHQARRSQTHFKCDNSAKV